MEVAAVAKPPRRRSCLREGRWSLLRSEAIHPCQCSFLSPVLSLPLGSASRRSPPPPGTNIRAAQETTIRTTTILLLCTAAAATEVVGACQECYSGSELISSCHCCC
ncbi:uncharacterized protein LOC110271487 [Arachis ipaensis]|uniref:uncharacterized protein LOC110271487 n=1 Tax=Arachis ipaensis TaxID=130454 RepID=UPI000A2B67B0|nr:uncharacterized protein LOC110271487 [Arachis ipaensis]